MDVIVSSVYSFIDAPRLLLPSSPPSLFLLFSLLSSLLLFSLLFFFLFVCPSLLPSFPGKKLIAILKKSQITEKDMEEITEMLKREQKDVQGERREGG